MPEVTYLEALRQGLWEEMERDDRVFILGEDVGVYGGAFKVTEGFQSHFGADRVIDTPISEAAIVGAAAGAAHMGCGRCARCSSSTSLSCAYDMLTNYVATARYRPISRRRWWCAAPQAVMSAAAIPIPETRKPPSFIPRDSRSYAPPRRGTPRG